MPPGAPGPIPEWWERFVARIIDGVIFGVIFGVIAAISTAIFVSSIAYDVNTGQITGASTAVLATVLPALVGGLLYAAYDVVMHSRNGQTLGKIVMKTRLVAADGSKPDQTTLIKRALIYPGVIALYGLLGFLGVIGSILGLAVAVFTLVDAIFILTDTPLRRALHDKWTNTIVVKAQ